MLFYLATVENMNRMSFLDKRSHTTDIQSIVNYNSLFHFFVHRILKSMCLFQRLFQSYEHSGEKITSTDDEQFMRM